MKKLITLSLLASVALLWGTVQAQQNCWAFFTWEKTGQMGIQFHDSSSAQTASWEWNFGDGATKSGRNPFHQYSRQDSFLVCLYTMDSLGCRDTFCTVVNTAMSPPPPAQDSCTIDFSFQTSPDRMVFFDNNSSGSLDNWNWTFGDGSSSTMRDPWHQYTQDGIYNVCLMASGDSCAWDSVCKQLEVKFEPDTTPCNAAYNFSNQGLMVVFQDISNKADAWSWNFGDGNGSTNQHPVHRYDSAGQYQVCLTIYEFSDSTQDTTCTSTWCNVVQVFEGQGWDTPCVAVGNVFFDLNGNGVQDQGENGISNIMLEAQPGNHAAKTDSRGSYNFQFEEKGEYVIKVMPPSNWIQTKPTDPEHYTVKFNYDGEFQSGFDFGIKRAQNVQDMQVVLTPMGRTAPGFDTKYQLTYRNIGSVNVSGKVELIYDPELTFKSSSPTQSGHNTGSRTLDWTYSNMAPGQEGNIYLVFNIKQTATLGDTLDMLAQVNPLAGDANASDNTYVLHQEIRGSYDPNDKLVEPAGKGSQGYIGLNPGYLTYTVRFQNTGTAEAVFVRIEDVLDVDLHLATLEILSASHEYSYELDGRKLLVYFNDINLPDSNTNEPASHGFVKFRILPLVGLPMGRTLENEANIYFDFNAPVLTNKTLNTIGNATGIASQKYQGVESRIYPNPTSDKAVVSINIPGNPEWQVELRDLSGRVVLFRDGIQGQTAQLEFNALSKGIYVYQITDVKGEYRSQGRVMVD